MIISSHVPAGAVVGLAARRPVAALAAGFVSHLVMDAMPHWGTGPGTEPEWMPIARKDGVAGLATIAVLAASAPRHRRLAVLAGITGACLPDTDKVGRYFVGRSPWPSRFDRFHEAIQNESRHRLPREIATAATLTIMSTALLCTLRTRARRHPDPATTHGSRLTDRARPAGTAVFHPTPPNGHAAGKNGQRSRSTVEA
jgi:hypothetical protein